MHIDRGTIDAVFEDWTTAPVSERVRAGLSLAELLTRRPQELDRAFLKGLEAQGLDRPAIEDVANVTFHFNFINRLADAFDFPRADEEQQRRLARLLDFAARIRVGAPPDPASRRGDDGVLRPTEVEWGRRTMLTQPAASDPALRRTVEARAARWFGGERHVEGIDELPEPLAAHVDKVARWAYKVIDEDMDALRQAGFDDPRIFELTMAAALGASLPALERLFALLEG